MQIPSYNCFGNLGKATFPANPCDLPQARRPGLSRAQLLGPASPTCKLSANSAQTQDNSGSAVPVLETNSHFVQCHPPSNMENQRQPDAFRLITRVRQAQPVASPMACTNHDELPVLGPSKQRDILRSRNGPIRNEIRFLIGTRPASFDKKGQQLGWHTAGWT